MFGMYFGDCFEYVDVGIYNRDECLKYVITKISTWSYLGRMNIITGKHVVGTEV